MLQATVIDTMDELERLQLVWRRLWRETRGASFFLTLDWLRIYWRHHGASQSLRVVVVEDGGEVVGIVPLVIRVEPTRIGNVRVLTYPLHDWGTFYGPIGPNSAATLATCFRHLQSMPRDWDLFDLRWVNREEVDQDRTPTALEIAGFPCRGTIWGTSSLIDFPATWGKYLLSRTPKFRNNLLRARRGADSAGEISFERYRPAGVGLGDGEPRWDLYEECLAVAERSWQGSSITGTTICHASVRAFFRDLFGVAAECGALDINLLRVRNQTVAFTFNLHTNGSLYGLRLGHDPAYNHMSPGRLIMANSVEDSCHRGDRCLDLGMTTMAFKSAWATRQIGCYRYTHYPLGSWRSQVLRLKHCLRPRDAVRPSKSSSAE